MTDILSALKECAENERTQLTRHECQALLNLILDMQVNEYADSCVIFAMQENEKNMLLPKSPDSPTVNAIKWIGRWSIFVVALFWSVFLIATWEWTNRYYADAGAVMTIFLHAAVMMREWWAK